MSIFSYRDFDEKSLMKDAVLMLKYINEVFAGVDSGYQQEAESAGWKVLNGEDIGFAGNSGAHDEFYGEVLALLTSQVNIMGKYDDAGNMTGLGIYFWGTGAAVDDEFSWLHMISDGLADIGIALGNSGASNDYIIIAFDKLLTRVAEFAQENGLTGHDVLISGHSMGGMGVNSMASASSLGAWGGFYEDSAYIATASPTQNQLDDKVLNLGLENDPVYRVLEGDSITGSTLGVHDKPLETCANNLVAFNDYYTSAYGSTLLNIEDWMNGHGMDWYITAFNTILKSDFYESTDLNSTIIVAQLSDAMRETTWVEDLDRVALPHEGPTFILGSEKADLIAGGKGIDYLEGFGGNDVFRDAGGFNVISGGKGYDTFDLNGELSKTSIAQNDDGTIFIKGADGGVSVLYGVEAIKETYWNWFEYKDLTYSVTSNGLALDGKHALDYADAVHGDQSGTSEIFAPEQGGFYQNDTSWLFSYDDTIMHGSSGSDVFVSGSGNDIMYANGGDDTFMFAGDSFGDNVIYQFDQDDKLVILGNKEINANGNYLDYLSECDDGLLFTCGDSSISLVGLTLDQVHESQFVLA
ncbi:polyurethanase [Pantoea alhagi]|uniref:polyurethanase n=1 Tax=Pantoea alhagi TaxID=1891675 RepID=UPI00202B086B|nr:polyurethanase [Pantoea alhagi]URQ60668.1 polyurethanase [Pantoea alhagi]